MKRVHYIVNPTAGAGKGLERWRKLEALLEKSNVDFDATFTNGKSHAVEIAKNVCDKYDVIVAVGGDGTVHEVANGMLSNTKSTAALSVMPVGTGNDFAAAWKIPSDVSRHVQSLANHQVVQQDVVEIEQTETNVRKYCISMAGIGLDSRVVENINAYRKLKQGGKLIYIMAALKAVQRFKPLKLDVVLTNENELVIKEGSAANVITLAFGIHKTNGGGLIQCPAADPADGFVDVTLVESLNALEIVRAAVALFRGSLLQHKHIKAFKVKSIFVEPLGGWILEADGELIGTPPFRLTVEEKALKVLVPKN